MASGTSLVYPVFMEIALQPCGWLSGYIGGSPSTGTDLFIRNLDATGRDGHGHRRGRAEDPDGAHRGPSWPGSPGSAR
ncbi:hypothetical protein ACFU6K_36985 [Kitasatospora sp. NPDC057512]|uniref:hypothetical protein n=1 Tax=Kitasatospora sp. NPDC057512 TaxID=3346154 RepID=UPI0036A2CF17